MLVLLFLTGVWRPSLMGTGYRRASEGHGKDQSEGMTPETTTVEEREEPPGPQGAQQQL